MWNLTNKSKDNLLSMKWFEFYVVRFGELISHRQEYTENLPRSRSFSFPHSLPPCATAAPFFLFLLLSLSLFLSLGSRHGCCSHITKMPFLSTSLPHHLLLHSVFSHLPRQAEAAAAAAAAAVLLPRYSVGGGRRQWQSRRENLGAERDSSWTP